MKSYATLIACAVAALWGSSSWAEAPLEGPSSRAPAAAAEAMEDAGTSGETPDADTPDEPVIDAEVKLESAELEQMRAAEELVHPDNPAGVDDPSRDTARTTLDSPLRQRLRDSAGRERGPAPEQGGRIAGLPELDHDLRQLQAEYDIPVEVNEKVISYVRFFQNVPLVRKHFVKWLGRSHKYIPAFRRILREEGLPEDTVYLAMIESGFANMATSRAKAVGPWQFIAETGRRMGLRQDFWVDERRDPEKAARAAARYLKELHQQTGDWRLAWAGYNAGVGKIYRAWAAGQKDFWSMAEGRVLKAETKGYVPKLMAAAIIAKHPEAFGFTASEIEAESWQDYELVTVPRATPLTAVAEAAGTTERAVLDLNPELRRSCTPPRPHVVKVPYGQAAAFAENWPDLEAKVGKLAFAQHKVGRGESLRAIARKYGIGEDTLARMNGVRAGRRVRTGTELVIPLNAASRVQAVAFAAAEPPAQAERSSRASSRRSRSSRGEVVLAARRSGGTAKVVKASLGTKRAASRDARERAVVKVRSGDTLWSIAQHFGVAVDELCRWNGIRNAKRFKLLAGKALVVYPRSGEASNAKLTARARAG